MVFVEEAPGRYPAPETPVVMDQISQELLPRVLPVLVGTKVRFPNKDQIHHQLYSFSKAKTFELPLYKGIEPSPVLMDKVGVVKLSCNIHDWMHGFVLVLQNPYFAKTDSNGRATITGVPPGDYQVALWSERLRGSVDDTRQKAAVGAPAVHLRFVPALNPPRKYPHHPVASY